MKKLLLALGSIAAVAAPVASVVACGAPKQKHIPLDKSVVTKQLPDMKKALETATGDDAGNPGPAFDNGVVDEDGTGFKVTFTPEGQTTDHIVITVNVDGTIKEVKGPAGMPLGPSFKTQLETLMKGATIDHSGDSSDEIKLEKTKFDDAVITAASLTFPNALPAGATNDEIRTQNKLVKTFENDYEQAVADQAAVVISAIDSTSLTQDSFNKLVAGADNGDGYFIELDEDEMNALGLDAVTINSLKKFISDGADIQIHKQAGTPTISGAVMCNGNQGTWNGSNVVNFGTTA